MKIITAKKVSALINKAKVIEKSKEKAKKVFYMIFLGPSTRYMQYGLREASYPQKYPRDIELSTFPLSILSMLSACPKSTLESQILGLLMGASKEYSGEIEGCEPLGET